MKTLRGLLLNRDKSSKRAGQIAESEACHYLESQGLHLILKNYRCALGEIDLIMRDGSTIVFIEVRYRGYKTHGDPLESITYKKQRCLRYTATHYLKKMHCIEVPCRFDVIGIQPEATGETSKITWIRNAF